jgi:hypothetical protein
VVLNKTTIWGVKNVNYAVIVTFEVAPAWLALHRKQRREYAAEIYAVMERYREVVKVKYFDADALSGSCTDFVICETMDLGKYHFMWEEIKDSAAFSQGYMKIKDVLLGIEHAYRHYETKHLGMEEEMV